MAVVSSDTLTLLNAYQRVMQISPFLFNQITGLGLYGGLTTPGEGVFVQPEREFLAQGIMQALVLGTNYIDTFHRPTFTTERFLLDPYRRLNRQLLKTDRHHVQAIGKRGTTVILANATVVYSDDNGDGINDRATITAPIDPSITDVEQIQAFFRVADGASENASILWQIEPLTVTLSGGNVILTGHRGLFAKPSLWADPYRSPNYNESSKNYGDNSNGSTAFVTEVDIYRVFPDTTDAVRFKRRQPCPTADNCDYLTDGGCIRIADGRLGLLSPERTALECFWQWGYEWVEIDYVAGIPLNSYNHMPDPALERAFIRLANAEMPTIPPNMKGQATMVWTQDAAPYPQKQGLEAWGANPFGTLIGHIEAFRIMQLPQYNVGHGGRLGG